MVHVSATEDMKTISDGPRPAKDDAAITRGKLRIFMKENVSQNAYFTIQRQMTNIESLHVNVIYPPDYDTFLIIVLSLDTSAVSFLPSHASFAAAASH